MPVKTVQDLFVEELRDIYHAERQITKALPKMAKAASSPELKQAFELHLEQTRGQIDRLDQVFEQLDVAKRGKKCEAMEGLLEEARATMEEIEDESVLDVGMIINAQKVEHYEIAGYGSLVALAKQLGHDQAASLLAETLAEEKETDQKLNEVALSMANLGRCREVRPGSGQQEGAGSRHRVIAVGYRGSGAGVKVYLDELQLFGGHAEGDELYSIEGVIGWAFSDSIGGDYPQCPPWTRLATTTSTARAAMTGSRAVAATTILYWGDGQRRAAWWQRDRHRRLRRCLSRGGRSCQRHRQWSLLRQRPPVRHRESDRQPLGDLLAGNGGANGLTGCLGPGRRAVPTSSTTFIQATATPRTRRTSSPTSAERRATRSTSRPSTPTRR